MLPEVRLLLDIQEIDKEILELKDQLANYPTIWEGIKKQTAKRKDSHDKALKAKERNQKDRKRVEQKIRLFSDDLKRSQTQAATVKTTKEYEATNKQTEALKAKLAALEEQGLELIEKEPELDAELKETEKEFLEAKDLYDSEKTRIREQFNEKKSRVDELESEKAKMIAKIPQKALGAYDRLFKRHPGSVIVHVQSGSCGGCHFGLLPNDLVQVHRQERVVHCPNCGRILSEDVDYVPEEEEASAV